MADPALPPAYHGVLPAIEQMYPETRGSVRTLLVPAAGQQRTWRAVDGVLTIRRDAHLEIASSALLHGLERARARQRRNELGWEGSVGSGVLFRQLLHSLHAGGALTQDSTGGLDRDLHLRLALVEHLAVNDLERFIHLSGLPPEAVTHGPAASSNALTALRPLLDTAAVGLGLPVGDLCRDLLFTPKAPSRRERLVTGIAAAHGLHRGHVVWPLVEQEIVDSLNHVLEAAAVLSGGPAEVEAYSQLGESTRRTLDRSLGSLAPFRAAGRPQMPAPLAEPRPQRRAHAANRTPRHLLDVVASVGASVASLLGAPSHCDEIVFGGAVDGNGALGLYHRTPGGRGVVEFSTRQMVDRVERFIRTASTAPYQLALARRESADAAEPGIGARPLTTARTALVDGCADAVATAIHEQIHATDRLSRAEHLSASIVTSGARRVVDEGLTELATQILLPQVLDASRLPDLDPAVRCQPSGRSYEAETQAMWTLLATVCEPTGLNPVEEALELAVTGHAEHSTARMADRLLRWAVPDEATRAAVAPRVRPAMQRRVLDMAQRLDEDLAHRAEGAGHAVRSPLSALGREAGRSAADGLLHLAGIATAMAECITAPEVPREGWPAPREGRPAPGSSAPRPREPRAL